VRIGNTSRNYTKGPLVISVHDGVLVEFSTSLLVTFTTDFLSAPAGIWHDCSWRWRRFSDTGKNVWVERFGRVAIITLLLVDKIDRHSRQEGGKVAIRCILHLPSKNFQRRDPLIAQWCVIGLPASIIALVFVSAIRCF
jgi:hypothetical protein